MNPNISIVIPTYNRVESLKAALKALQVQDANPNNFEVIVIVDGSTDSTLEFLKRATETQPNLSYEFQENQGASAARNRGVARAKSDLILFIGDDILAEPNFISEHLKFHEENPEKNKAALGLTVPQLEHQIDPDFVKWIHESGIQFAYGQITENQVLDDRFFYTSNISLKKELLLAELFNETFTGWGFEDSELGLRLQEKFDLKLIYHPKAKAWHTELFDEAKVCQRLRSSAKNLKKFQELHPNQNIWPGPAKIALQSLLTSKPMLWFAQKISQKLSQKLYWRLKMKHCFLEGIRNEKTHQEE